MPDTFLIARLNARVQPIDRSDYFEEPLNEKLAEHGIGEVTGGGTQMADDPDGIAFCEIEIAVKDPTEPTRDLIVGLLEDLGAPKGSVLQIAGQPDRPFGKFEGLAIFVNGTDLPDDVYANSDINVVIEELEDCLGEHGAFRGYWEGERETALYFYGPSFQSMKAATADRIARTPLCQQARVVQIA